MGSGVGMYVRICSIIKPQRPLILLKKYSKRFVTQTINYLKKKLNINCYLLIREKFNL